VQEKKIRLKMTFCL